MPLYAKSNLGINLSETVQDHFRILMGSLYAKAHGKGLPQTRLAPVLKTIFHQCVISFTCSQSNSDGSVKQRHQS